MNRKKFISHSLLASGSILMFLEACAKNGLSGGSGEGANGYSFGTGDIALLNFAYVLSQVQAGFYTSLLGSTGITDPTERALLGDVLKHETAQREFYKTALGSNALTGLQLEFSSIDFTNRTSALASAIFFEDLTVQALNGIARYMQATAFLTILGEVVSVQARHASYVHEISLADTFTGAMLDSNSLEIDLSPAAVLSKLQTTFIKTTLDAGSLPSGNPAAGTLAIGALTIVDFALRFKLLKLYFYQYATGQLPGSTAGQAASFTALSSSQQAAFMLMEKDEAKHVSHLTSIFTGTSVTPAVISDLTIDITANQLFPDISTNPVTLLLAAQVIEDTSVRYFKGELQKLAEFNGVLTTFLNIHSVEARHASYIRLARLETGITIKPWVTLNGTLAAGTSTATDSTVNNSNINNVYLNEDNTAQAQIEITGINGHKEIDANAASEAFDEILTRDQAHTIIISFISGGI